MAEKYQVERLEELVKQAKAAISAAEAYADEHGLTFHFEIDWHNYVYHGKGSVNPSWTESSCYNEEEFLESGQWTSSSDYC